MKKRKNKYHKKTAIKNSLGTTLLQFWKTITSFKRPQWFLKLLEIFDIDEKQYWNTFRNMFVINSIIILLIPLFFPNDLRLAYFVSIYFLSVIPLAPFSYKIAYKIKNRAWFGPTEREDCAFILYLLAPILVFYKLIKYYFSKKA